MKAQKELTGLSLLRFGYIHVTGLPTRRSEKEDENIIQALPQNWGRHDWNHGMEVAITLDGEVWLRAAPTTVQYAGHDEAIAKLCPKRGDVFVPCSNGEGIPSYMLFHRVSDPYWDGGGRYRPEPEQKPGITGAMINREAVLQ